MSASGHEPNLTQQVKFDAICMRFEQALRSGQRPGIEDFLGDREGPPRAILLSQLLLLELEYLEETDACPKIDDYLGRFSDDQAVVRRAFEEHNAIGTHSRSASDMPATRDESTNEQPGALLDRYKLLEQIGEGGMGVVFMAEQQRPVRRKVALKIIKPGLDTKQVIARFEAERQALAMMDHPSIARVLDAGSTDQRRPYFVMELVRGVSITEFCDQNKLNTEQRLKLFKQVCQAVQHAHTKGIIHRDLKPNNVLVTLHDGEPVPKIIDFGVSKAMGGQLTEKTLFTAFAQMVGTPLYMSPEQAEMSGLDIDTRTDIYSLGVLLYELLTGTTPFDRKRLQTAAFDELRRIIREEEPQRPSTRVSTLGKASITVSDQRSTDPGRLKQLLQGELDWIVMKTLEKDRSRRYETANGLVAEINRYLNGEPVNACPPSATYRLRKFVQRYQSQVAGAAAFVAILLTSSIIAWYLYADARVARDDAVAARDEARSDRDRAIDAEREVRLERDRADRHADELKARLYDYNMSRATAARRDGNHGQVDKYLDECLEGQRGWEWSYVRHAAGAPIELQLEAPTQAIAVSPTDPVVALGDVQGNIQILNERDGKVLWRQATGSPFVVGTCFSSDGKFVAVTHANQNYISPGWQPTTEIRSCLELRAAESGAVVWKQEFNAAACVVGAFSPDDKHLAVCVGTSVADLKIHLRETTSGSVIWQESLVGLPFSMLFSPDGNRIYLSEWSSFVIETSSTVRCLNVDDHQTIWSKSRSASSAIALTKDGSQLVLGGMQPGIEVWDAATGDLQEEIDTGNSEGTPHVAFSHDGSILASRDFNKITIWDWAKREPIRRVHVKRTEFTAPLQFSSASSNVMTLDSWPGDRLQQISTRTSTAELVLAGHQGPVRGVCFSPDGDSVLSLGFDGTLREWETRTGQLSRLIADSATEKGTTVTMSPTGDHFATGSENGVCVWNAKTMERVHFWSDLRRIRSLKFSSDGRRLISGSFVKDQSVALMDLSNQSVVNFDAVNAHGVDFTADARHAISVSFDWMPKPSGKLDVWDVESSRGPQTIRPERMGEPGSEVLRIPTQSDNQLVSRAGSPTPSSDLFAVAFRNRIELWTLGSSEPVMTLQGHDRWVSCMAVNRSGTRLYSGDLAGVMNAWNLNTGERLLTIQAHKPIMHVAGWGQVGLSSIALSPDERTLATTGGDGLIKLWETIRPSAELTRRREVVARATKIVIQAYQTSSQLSEILSTFSEDLASEEEVLKVAIEIANTCSRLTTVRKNFVFNAIEEATGTTLDDPESEPTEPWFTWDFRAHVLVFDGSLDGTSTISMTRECNEQILSLLIDDETHPRAHQVPYLSAIAASGLGRWDVADRHLTRALALAEEDPLIWLVYAQRAAILLAYTQQWDRYDELCEQSLEKAAKLSASLPAVATPLVCLLVPGRVDPSKPAQLADRGYNRRQEYESETFGLPGSAEKVVSEERVREGILHTFAFTKGMAELRKENFEAALPFLREAKDGFQAIGFTDALIYGSCCDLFQSIALAKLGKHERARELFERAVQSIDRECHDYEKDGFYPYYGEWQVFQVIRREAELELAADTAGKVEE